MAAADVVRLTWIGRFGGILDFLGTEFWTIADDGRAIGRRRRTARSREWCGVNRFIAASSAFYAALGVAALVRPSVVPEMFGGSAGTADSRIEIRAVYGGLPLALAGLLAISPAAAPAVAVATAGMAVGRAGGWLVEGERVNLATKLSLAAEVGVAAAIVAGMRRGSRASVPRR